MTPVLAPEEVVSETSPRVSSAAHIVAGESAVRRPQASELFGRSATGDKVNWKTAFFMGAFHVGAIAALFLFSWQALVITVVLYFMAINMGVGMGYHRLLTHRGYKVPKWLEYFLAICGTLALEGGPIFWVATHRVHHQHTDKPGDPHSPNEGGWWSHAGWILSGKAMAADTSVLARYVPDLGKDRFLVWLSNYHWVPLTAVGFGLLALGHAIGGWHMGFSLVFWGVFLRVSVGLHATWLVNSATHMWGSRRFATRDESRNSFWVALLTGGEGWHNNHHAHPVSAKHGLAWYEIDPNWYGIWLLKKVGLAKQVIVAEFDRENPRPAGA